MATKEYRLLALVQHKFSKVEGEWERAIFHKGDKITLTKEEAEPLLSTGGIEPWTEQEDAPVASEEAPTGPAALSGQTASPVVTESAGEATLEDPNADPGTSEEHVDPDPDHVSDDGYDEMSYPSLQQTAKDRGLNAGGSAAEIVARLRENDANPA